MYNYVPCLLALPVPKERIAQLISSISLETTVIPRRNWKPAVMGYMKSCQPGKMLESGKKIITVLSKLCNISSTRRSVSSPFHHQMKHWEELKIWWAAEYLVDELRGVSSGDEILCLDITSKTKWFYQEKLRMQKWAVFHLILKHSLTINFLCIWIIDEFEKLGFHAPFLRWRGWGWGWGGVGVLKKVL